MKKSKDIFEEVLKSDQRLQDYLKISHELFVLQTQSLHEFLCDLGNFNDMICFASQEKDLPGQDIRINYEDSYSLLSVETSEVDGVVLKEIVVPISGKRKKKEFVETDEEFEDSNASDVEESEISDELLTPRQIEQAVRVLFRDLPL